jgi:hypothetical protein
MLKYQYSVIRYIHDTLRGEFANIGVVVWADKEKVLMLNDDATRLFVFFGGFEVNNFNNILLNLDSHFKSYPKHLTGLDFLHDAVPDTGLNLNYSQVMAGIEKDKSLNLVAKSIFEKQVL